MFNEFLSSSKETSRLMGDVDSIKIQVGEPMNEVGLEDDITDFSEGVSFEDTFWHMKYRNWFRLLRSAYSKPYQWHYHYLLFYLIIYGIYLGIEIGYFHLRENTSILEYVLMGFTASVVGYISPGFNWLIRIVLFEIYVAMNIFFIMDLTQNKTALFTTVIYVVGALFLTFINFLFYPVLVRAWYSITGRLTEVELTGENRYEFEQEFYFSDNVKCVYEGPLVRGLPEGRGEWIDTSYQGEVLRGIWKAGFPVGPFEAIENDSHNILVNLRIIYATNCGGYLSFTRDPLSVGVASIEACVSGSFFKDYPLVHLLVGPIQCEPKKFQYIKTFFDEKAWIHIDDGKPITSLTIAVNKKDRRLNISGFDASVRAPQSVLILMKEKAPYKPPDQAKQEDEPEVLDLPDTEVPSRVRGKRLTSLSLGPSSPLSVPMTREEVRQIREGQEKQLARQQKMQNKIINSLEEREASGFLEKGGLDFYESDMEEKEKKDKSPVTRDIKPVLSNKRISALDSPTTPSNNTNNTNNANANANASHATQPRHSSQSRLRKPEYFLELDPTWHHVSGTEGILYIHGINHTLEDALKRFGQFLAIGGFPAYIKPFVFSWPASTNPLFYWCAASSASDNDVHRDLRKFIIMLHKAGIRTLHVMCHSMGTRLFLRAWPVLRQLFSQRKIEDRLDRSIDSMSVSSYLTQVDAIPNYNPINLQNLILLNPDYELNTFLNDFPELRAFIPSITIYSDSRDQALIMASRVNRKETLGLGILEKRDLQLQNIDLREIDVIDTVDLDRNMNESFHGYFNINRVMVDDLHELILTRKRAEERVSRLKPHKGIFRFSIVPSSVLVV